VEASGPGGAHHGSWLLPSFFLLATTAAAHSTTLFLRRWRVRIHVDFTAAACATPHQRHDHFHERTGRRWLCRSQLRDRAHRHSRVTTHVTVSGKSLLTTETTDVDIDSSDTRDVRSRSSAQARPCRTPAEALVSATDLESPPVPLTSSTRPRASSITGLAESH